MTDLIVDKLVFKDIQLTATNDDQYFVFEDILYQVKICFNRLCKKIIFANSLIRTRDNLN